MTHRRAPEREFTALEVLVAAMLLSVGVLPAPS